MIIFARQSRRYSSGLRLHHPGFTLVEMTVATAIASILVLAMGSIVVLASRGIDAGNTPVAATAVARTAADEITGELAGAIAITEQTSTALTLTVPDHDGDGSADTLRYAWSGASGLTITKNGTSYTIPGYTLTREFNAAAPEIMASDVRAFNLSYLTRTVGPPPPPSEVESPEQILIFYDNPSSMTSADIKKMQWLSEYFKPSLPGSAASWKLTRVKLLLQRSGTSTDDVVIEVRTVDTQQRPTGVVLASTTLNAASLPEAAGWVDVNFTGLSNLNPAEGLAVVVTSKASKTAAHLGQDNSGAAAGTAWSASTDSGSTWSSGTTAKSVQFYAYGTITTRE